MTYTHTRIRKEYLDKLQVLAVRNKRSAIRQLEVLIDQASQPSSDDLAQRFHEAYERLAPLYGYETSLRTRGDWLSVPENNKQLMRAVIDEVFLPMVGQ